MAHYSLLNNDDRGDIETFLAASVQCESCCIEQILRVDDTMDGSDYLRHARGCTDGSRIKITLLDWYYAFGSPGYNWVDDPEGPYPTELAARAGGALKVATLPPVRPVPIPPPTEPFVAEGEHRTSRPAPACPPCGYCGRDDGRRPERAHMARCVWGCRTDCLPEPCLSVPEGVEIRRCSRERDHDGDHVVCRANEDHSITHEVERWRAPAAITHEGTEKKGGQNQRPSTPRPAPPQGQGGRDSYRPASYNEALGALDASRLHVTECYVLLDSFKLALRNAAYALEFLADSGEGWRKSRAADEAEKIRATIREMM